MRVSNNLQLGLASGEPGMVEMVKAYLSVQSGGLGETGTLDEEKYDGRSAWAMLYTALRAGDLNAALFIVDHAG